MKKVILSVLLILGVCAAPESSVYAKDKKDVYKERQEINKKKRKILNEKASKDARNEAKSLAKQGWKSAPGTLPLEKQIDRQFLLLEEYDEDGYPAYLFGSATSTGGNYDAAKLQATALAKQDLAGQIETSVGALIENDIETKQLDNGDAVSITKSLAAGKQLIQNKLGRTLPVIEIYRDNGNGKEVRIMIAYNYEMARALAKKAIQQDLEARGDSLSNKLDKILNW